MNPRGLFELAKLFAVWRDFVASYRCKFMMVTLQYHKVITFYLRLIVFPFSLETSCFLPEDLQSQILLRVPNDQNKIRFSGKGVEGELFSGWKVGQDWVQNQLENVFPFFFFFLSGFYLFIHLFVADFKIANPLWTVMLKLYLDKLYLVSFKIRLLNRFSCDHEFFSSQYNSVKYKSCIHKEAIS